jgi:hypothetical protein
MAGIDIAVTSTSAVRILVTFIRVNSKNAVAKTTDDVLISQLLTGSLRKEQPDLIYASRGIRLPGQGEMASIESEVV